MSEQYNPVLCCMAALCNHTPACKTSWPLFTALFKVYICIQCLLNVLFTADELKPPAVITWFTSQDQLQGPPQPIPQSPWTANDHPEFHSTSNMQHAFGLCIQHQQQARTEHDPVSELSQQFRSSGLPNSPAERTCNWAAIAVGQHLLLHWRYTAAVKHGGVSRCNSLKLSTWLSAKL